ncbi:PQQ-binding-like beta-propeller repeat protein [Alienimonas chondri]|uniref:Pyrrolo-quinoline quinone repeat domain-containing protein n=1 Tax=Alienimonas chondri TaxID=2681879 RepID=A0ABX1VE58_9PLAN|nr:PQQ-binding-like beta-propeller repeat protein [Alienimonas chondri]NNJ25562.1 hypothetical protein [Alienimonas chondri]
MPRRRPFSRGSARDPRRFSIPFAAASLLGVILLPTVAQPRNIQGLEDRDGQNFEDPGAGFTAPPLFHLDRAALRQIELSRRAQKAGRVDEAAALAELATNAEFDSVMPDGTPVQVAAADVLHRAASEAEAIVELRLGVAAEDAFEAAFGSGDPQRFAAIAARFPGTIAGRRAEARVADLAMDRGEFEIAARLYAQLAERSATRPVDQNRWRMKAATAYQRAGKGGRADALVRRVPVADRAAFLNALFPQSNANADDPAAVLAALGRGAAPPEALPEWPLVGRLPGRGLTLPGGDPPERVNAVGGPLWTMNLTDEIPPTGADGPGRVIASTVHRDRMGRGESMWPAARPLALREPGGGDSVEDVTVVFTSPSGLTAADAATGEVRWRSGLMLDSEFYQLTRGEEEATLSDRGRGAITGLRNLHEERGYRDAASGALSADDRHVYAVRNVDLPKLILDPDFNALISNGVDLARRNRVNRLVAYDRQTGRIAWTVGGTFTSFNFEGPENPTDEAFFCGPPLPTPHGLAVIAETGGVLRLLVLDPDDGAVRRVMPIAVPALPTFEPPRWRLAGLGVSAAAGLWIVPTSASGVAAVDPLTGDFVWTYRYVSAVQVEDGPPVPRRASLSASEDDQPKWVDHPPKIVADRVLLTPRDSEELHCLDLATGEPIWTRPRGAGRQVAAVVSATDADAAADGIGARGDGDPLTVLVVGDDGVRGLALSDGIERWFTPLPAAVGDATLAGDALLVPLSDDTIVALRPEDGSVLNRLPASGGAGNLIAAGGRLISQTPTEVGAFRTRTETDAAIQAAFAEADAERALSPALLLRAGLALQDGRHADGVADLIAAATASAPAGNAGVAARLAASRARDRLSEVLADGLRRDFATFDPLFRTAAKVLGNPPTGKVARAYVDGLTDSGRLAEAFRTLARLEDGAARPDVTAVAWARPRLPRLFLAADQSVRGGMVKDVADLYAAATDGDSLEAFAGRFGRLCSTPEWRSAAPPLKDAVDLTDAALRRAAAMQRENRKSTPLAAARLLRWAASRPGAAPADETLAEIYASAGASSAAAYLRGQPVSDPLQGRRLAVAEADDRGRVPAMVRIPVGSLPPWETGGRLTGDNVGPHLRWQTDDGRLAFSHILLGGPPRSGSRAMWDGHLLVAGLGDRIVALDTLTRSGTPEPLWRGRITRNVISDGPFFVPSDFDAATARGSRFDGPAVLTPRQLVVRTGSTLTARHPLTSQMLWRRTGLPSQARVIGDDRSIIVLPLGGDRATRLSADDGSEIGLVDVGPAGDRWLERGTRIWSRSFENGAEPRITVSCIDVAGAADDGVPDDGAEPSAAPRTVWSRSFSPDAVFAPNDAATHLTVATPDRRAVVLDLETGEDVESADLGPGPAAASVWGERSLDGWTVIVSDEPDARAERLLDPFGRRAPEATESFAYGLKAGRVLWSRSVSGLPGSVWQPPRLPILALPGRTREDDGGSPYGRQFTLTLIDTRNGAELAEVENHAPLTPIDWEIGPAGPWFVDGSPSEAIDVRLRTRGPDLSVRVLDEPLAEPARATPPSPKGEPSEGS